jgi:hypothetical protein
MSATPGNSTENGEEHTSNFPIDTPGGTIYSYTLDDTRTPGGIKVKWKIRVIAGPAAARVDARQAQAITEALRWTQRHSRQLRAQRPRP